MFFSVVIPVYNKEKEIRSTLETVLVQSFIDFEVVLVDDGSSDGSMEIVKGIKDSRIRLFSQKNQGVSAARNAGIRQAVGQYIALLDADDRWEPSYLKEQYDLIQKYPQCGVFAVNYSYVYSSGAKVPNRVNHLDFCGMDGIRKDYFRGAAFSQPPVCSSAVVIRKDCLESVGGFPVGITSGEDLITWARLAYRYEIAYSKKCLAWYILREELELTSTPTRFFDGDYVEQQLIALLRKDAGYMYKSSLRKYIGLWFKMKSSVYFRADRKRECWKYGMKSLRYNPACIGQYAILLLAVLPLGVRNMAKRYVQSVKTKNRVS